MPQTECCDYYTYSTFHVDMVQLQQYSQRKKSWSPSPLAKKTLNNHLRQRGESRGTPCQQSREQTS